MTEDRARVVRLDEGDPPTDGDTVVRRFDVATLGAKRRTPQGFLQVRARLTRRGVLTYRDGRGQERRELHLDDEHSISTLRGAPLTDMHKGGMVNPDNVRELQIGRVGEDVRIDGRFVEATITIQDRNAIEAVEKGERREISAGYECKLDATPGEHDGERYDAIQTGIVYNHAAIGPRDWGRAGSEVGLRLDAADAVSDRLESRADGALGLFIQQQLELLDLKSLDLARELGIDELRLQGFLQGFDQPTNDELQRLAKRLQISPERLRNLIPDRERQDTQETIPMKKIKVTLDGAEFEIELPEALAKDFENRWSRVESQRTDALDKVEKLTADRDEKAEKLDAAEKKVKTLESPESIQERIRARVKLEDDARQVLDADDAKDLAKLSDLEVMQRTIEKAEPTFKLDGKGEETLRGLFELVTEKARAASDDGNRERHDGGRGDARRALDGDRDRGRTPRHDARNDEPDPYDASGAKARFDKRSRGAWQEPLTISKDQATQ